MQAASLLRPFFSAHQIAFSTARLAPSIFYMGSTSPCPRGLAQKVNSRSVSSQEVLEEARGPNENLRVATLNREKQLNALNLNTCLLLQDMLTDWEEDDTVCAVILKGKGEKAFCAGGDVRSLYDAGSDGDTEPAESFFAAEYKVDYMIGTYKKPFIAFMDGITMGGGCGVSMHGAFRIATEKTMMAMPEAALGLFPDVGAAHFLTKLPGKMGVYLSLTGARLKAPELIELGLATHFVPSEKLPALEEAIAVLGTDARSFKRITAVIEEYSCPVPEPAESSPLAYKEAIDQCFQGETVEEIRDALESLAQEQEGEGETGAWASKTLSVIDGAAPISLKVIMRQLKICKDFTLADVFRTDYRMASRFVRESSFYEGVRAILVDKDRTPKWEFKSLSDVNNDMVDKYFQSPSSGDLILQDERMLQRPIGRL